MAAQGTGDSPAFYMEELSSDVVTRLYSRLTLFEALATFKNEPQQRAKSNDEICEARRDFLDAFAYLCDTQKGGASVTAAGLQKLPLSNILWLAANEGISRDIKSYADSLLQTLKEIDPEKQNSDIVTDKVFHQAVDKCGPRIRFYKDEMQKHARNCRMQLREESPTDTVRILRAKLRKLSEPPASRTLAALVDLCYAMRGPGVDEIRRRSKNRGDDFERLAHYLGRLGATRSSANTVVRSMRIVPALRQISDIRCVKAPDAQMITIDHAHMSPYEIVWLICKETTSQNPMQFQSALHALVELDLPPKSELRAALAARTSILTRVHAELQIADCFGRDYRHMSFVDDDKYIGCSKPACFFCYSWLSNHRHRYVLPATHHKIITGCRGPDNDINEAGATFLKEMYSKLCGTLGQDILEHLLDLQRGTARIRHQYMSTEGSSRAPSQIASMGFNQDISAQQTHGGAARLLSG